MPATTARGYPYPLGTDRVADGDDAIHSLATQIDTALGASAAGTVGITHASAGTTASASVTFPVGRFTAPPTFISVQPWLTTNGGVLEGGGSPTGVLATGFTANYYRPSGTGAMTVQWLAVLV